MHMRNRRSSGSHGSSDMGADARSIGHSAGRIHGSSVLLEAGANLGHRPRVGSVGDAQCAKASNSRSEEGMCQSSIPYAPSGRDGERRGQEHGRMDFAGFGWCRGSGVPGLVARGGFGL